MDSLTDCSVVVVLKTILLVAIFPNRMFKIKYSQLSITCDLFLRKMKRKCMITICVLSVCCFLVIFTTNDNIRTQFGLNSLKGKIYVFKCLICFLLFMLEIQLEILVLILSFFAFKRMYVAIYIYNYIEEMAK